MRGQVARVYFSIYKAAARESVGVIAAGEPEFPRQSRWRLAGRERDLINNEVDASPAREETEKCSVSE